MERGWFWKRSIAWKGDGSLNETQIVCGDWIGIPSEGNERGQSDGVCGNPIIKISGDDGREGDGIGCRM